jgi:hypothetical protein
MEILRAHLLTRRYSTFRIRDKEDYMRAAATALLSALAIGFFSAPALLREKGGDDRTGPYDVVQD